MKRCTALRRSRATRALQGAAWLALMTAAAAAGRPLPRPQASPRVHLDPRLSPGNLMRYQIQFQTTSQTKRSGAVSDPQGPAQTVVTWDAVLRVEVLPASTGVGAGSPGTVRLRTTYEKSVAKLESDTPDPEQESVEKQYAQMQGRSLEFSLDPAGRISGVQGLEGIVSDQEALKAAEQWMAQFSSSASAPPAGVVPGEKWSFEEAASSLPLAGYVWQTESTYLRNEPCRLEGLARQADAPSESCAVILAQLSLRGPRSRKDQTPEEYRRNGLETSGDWSGSGESLTYISLQDGWVVSVTQNMSQQMDVTIGNAPDRGAVHYAGTVATRSSLSLVPPEPAASR